MLPAVELHGLRASDAADGSSAQEPIQNIKILYNLRFAPYLCRAPAARRFTLCAVARSDGGLQPEVPQRSPRAAESFALTSRISANGVERLFCLTFQRTTNARSLSE